MEKITCKNCSERIVEETSVAVIFTKEDIEHYCRECFRNHYNMIINVRSCRIDMLYIPENKQEICEENAKPMQKWEYLHGIDCSTDQLDELGQDGWELVTVNTRAWDNQVEGHIARTSDYILKRPLDK